MGTVFIPIDDCDQENGCLKVNPVPICVSNHGFIENWAAP